MAAGLAALYPEATCELDHANAYQLLVATILSAQSTDKLINTVTPRLFAKYPDATALAGAEPAELEELIHATGFFRMKAKHLLGMARAVVDRHGGEIPADMDALTALPGVARKTANVVLGTAFGKNEGIAVDTHVTRLSQRLGLSREVDPVKIEQDLMALIPRDQWTAFGHRLILHGRRVCRAKAPDCEHCALAPICPSAFVADLPAAAPARRAARAAGGKHDDGKARAAGGKPGAGKARPARAAGGKPGAAKAAGKRPAGKHATAKRAPAGRKPGRARARA